MARQIGKRLRGRNRARVTVDDRSDGGTTILLVTGGDVPQEHTTGSTAPNAADVCAVLARVRAARRAGRPVSLVGGGTALRAAVDDATGGILFGGPAPEM
jgi:hypothetical protein